MDILANTVITTGFSSYQASSIQSQALASSSSTRGLLYFPIFKILGGFEDNVRKPPVVSALWNFHVRNLASGSWNSPLYAGPPRPTLPALQISTAMNC
jgi:hypothetical protein